LGETRHLSETPGHLAALTESDDLISTLVISIEFFWDCAVLPAGGRDFFFVSHDEYLEFGSRDREYVEKCKASLVADRND
jgi:hypothetical protein